MKVNIKKLHENAVIPAYAYSSDAGLDMTAVSKEYDENGNVVYGTGVAISIPKNHVGLLFPRSSNAKKDLILSNSVGVIDSGYIGEIIFKFKPSTYYEMNDSPDFVHVPAHTLNNYEVGDRIGQLIIMPYPQIEFNEVDDLSYTDRGIGAFGSTDPVTSAIESNCE